MYILYVLCHSQLEQFRDVGMNLFVQIGAHSTFEKRLGRTKYSPT